MIDVVEKKLSNITGGSLSVKCKDFRVVKLDISSTEDLNNVATTLESLSSISNNCFSKISLINSKIKDVLD